MTGGQTSSQLSDGVVLLRPFRLEDAATHLAGEDLEQVRWLGGGCNSTLDGVRKWIVRNQEYWQHNGPVFCFAIWCVEPCALCGMVEANTDFEHIAGIVTGDANISYALYPQARGRGYASRAVRLVEEFLRGRELQRAVIRVETANVASARIPRRLGYKMTAPVVDDAKTLDVYVKTLATEQ